MGVYRQMTVQEAIAFQFRMVALITEEIPGALQLEAGDYGVVPGLGRPRATARVERAIARIFEADDVALVRGAGTGAIRMALMSVCRPGDRIILHKPPVYPTTSFTIDSLGLERVYVDLNDTAATKAALAQGAKALYIQTTHQHEGDHYDVAELSVLARQAANPPYVITDDNYAVFKAPLAGPQMGSDLSAFSFFKAMGPEGVGCVMGKRELIDEIRRLNYSGGTQVQGPEAMDALRSCLMVPVMQAIASDTNQEVIRRWSEVEQPGVHLEKVNIQGYHVAVRFDEPIAEQVIAAAVKLGAVPHPVGAESRYEMGPIFYRPSATTLQRNPEWKKHLMRVVPNRAGADLIIDLLKRSVVLSREAQAQG